MAIGGLSMMKKDRGPFGTYTNNPRATGGSLGTAFKNAGDKNAWARTWTDMTGHNAKRAAEGGGMSMDELLAAAQGPQWASNLDEAGNLKSQYQVADPRKLAGSFGTMATPEAVSADPTTYDAYSGGDVYGALKDRALATGDSPWLKMQLERQGLEQAGAFDDAAARAASGEAQARSALSMRGGLSGGAAERLAAGGARGSAEEMAAAARQGSLERMGLRTADEEQKMGLLGQAAGMETNMGMTNAQQALQNAQFNSQQGLGAQQFNAGMDMDTQRFNIGNEMGANQFDIGNELGVAQSNRAATLDEVSAGRQADLFKYGERMKALGAGASSEAISKGGKK